MFKYNHTHNIKRGLVDVFQLPSAAVEKKKNSQILWLKRTKHLLSS